VSCKTDHCTIFREFLAASLSEILSVEDRVEMAVTLSPISYQELVEASATPFRCTNSSDRQIGKSRAARGMLDAVLSLTAGVTKSTPSWRYYVLWLSIQAGPSMLLMHPTTMRGMGEMGRSNVTCRVRRSYLATYPAILTGDLSCSRQKRHAGSLRPLVWVMETVSKPFLFFYARKSPKGDTAERVIGQDYMHVVEEDLWWSLAYRYIQ
jgi:hypothetical protein